MLANQVCHTVVAMCRVLRVCRRSYYKWKRAGTSVRERQDDGLRLRMRTVHAGAKSSYGVRRMAMELRKQEWPLLGCRRVHRLMRADGLVGHTWKKKVFTTTRAGDGVAVPADLVGRQFARGRLNELWVADSTYIRVREGFGYLALVTDACSRRIIGRQFGLCHDTELMLGALGQAVCSRPCDGVIHHSDRGVQYLSERYRSYCARHGVVQSVGRIGNSYDNAMAESVFATLKRELLMEDDGGLGFEDMRRQLYDYIDGFYNAERMHSKLGWKSPIEYEREILALGIS